MTLEEVPRIAREDRNEDSRAVLRDLLERKDDKFAGVLVLILHDNGAQESVGSAMSHHERAFLKCFFDTCVYRWFTD